NIMHIRAHHAAIASTLILATVAAPALAEDFFKGKEITLYVGSSPGGPYDAYARMLARHMGRYIAGNPGFVVQNMPGASGRRLMGYMQGIAPKDGTAMAAAHRAL